jgi:BMFP domain-containing protein YqiC
MMDGSSGNDRRRGLFDDLAGVAGGAFSALAGLRTEAEAVARSQAEALAARLDLVRREDLDAAMEVARRAREHAEALEARIEALEARLAKLEAPRPPEVMIASAERQTPPGPLGETSSST